MAEMIKILIVDDSEIIRDYLGFIFSLEPDFHVVGKAVNGSEAVQMAKEKRPDVITMDIEMPVMNGYEATKRIMSTQPVPIVVITSSFQKSEVEKTFKAMDAGALTVLEKPVGLDHPNYERDRRLLVRTVRTMSEVKLVTRFRKYREDYNEVERNDGEHLVKKQRINYKITAIGVSTGGPPVLNQIFSSVPENFKMPIVVVQHIPEGFLDGMVEWLNQHSKLPVSIAEKGEILQHGRIYFCPAECFMSISSKLEVNLEKESRRFSIKPSVSCLFQSLFENFKEEAIGILLTGMGRDGAEELALMKSAGALTIAQDKESSAVHGMPGAAIKLQATTYILSPLDIVRKLKELNTEKYTV